VGKDTVRSHYDAFLTAAADAVSSYGGAPVSPQELSTRVAEAGGTLVPAAEDLPEAPESAEMSTYLSMPLRGHGGTGGRAGAVQRHPQRLRGDRAVHLKLLEGPSAIVIDNARLSASR
jgi:hypothetical protein